MKKNTGSADSFLTEEQKFRLAKVAGACFPKRRDARDLLLGCAERYLSARVHNAAWFRESLPLIKIQIENVRDALHAVLEGRQWSLLYLSMSGEKTDDPGWARKAGEPLLDAALTVLSRPPFRRTKRDDLFNGELIFLSELYKRLSGKAASVSNFDGKPSGQFLDFVEEYFKALGVPHMRSRVALAKAIQRASQPGATGGIFFSS